MENPTEVDQDVLIIYDDIDITPPGTPDPTLSLDEGYDIFGLPRKQSQLVPRQSTRRVEVTPGTSNSSIIQEEPSYTPPNPPQSCNCLKCVQSTSSRAWSDVEELLDIYARPLPVPELREAALINGAMVHSLHTLRPTNNLKELKMRAANSHQRFITREKQSLYLSRDIIQRIDFEAVQKRKRNDKTINLPDRHQVRLRVRADGVIIFHHYHKRGIGKKRNLERPVQQRGECSDT